MLAALHKFHVSRQISILALIFGLISGCSRDNPLSTPDVYVEPETPFCTDDSPFSFELVKRVDFTNTNNDFVIDYDSFSNEPPVDGETPSPQDSVNSRVITYVASAPFLSNSTMITPIPLTDYKRDEIGEVILNDNNEPTILLFNKEVSLDVLQNLSEEEIEQLKEFDPEVTSISYSIIYSEGGEILSDVFDENLVSLTADLLEGQNDFEIKVNAGVIVPRTGLECSENNDETVKTRAVTLTYTLHYTLKRDSLEAFTDSDPDTESGVSELDTAGLGITQDYELGKVIALNDQFLVLGAPEDSSSFQGIISVSDLNLVGNAASSGAAFVYMKDENNVWAPHSIIKSSNNEAGDSFGAAISLNGSQMVISAPGEDSNAIGVHESQTSDAETLKINNSAANSGAVYMFTFNEETNSWEEVYYIKPDANLISDGSFNKRFGEKLLLSDGLLLLSAPGEDSASGNAADSSFPDSGIVYAYSLEQSPLNLTFISGIKAFNPGAGDLFGSSLALSDRYIAIGAPFEDNDKRFITNNLSTSSDLDLIENNNSVDSGAVYIYTIGGDGTQIDPYSYIKSSNSDANDFFGSSLAFEGSSLFVGAPGEDGSGTDLNRDMTSNNSTDSGAVYLFSLNENRNVWFETSYIKAIDNQAESAFGQYIGFDKNNLVVASPTYNSELYNNAGKVYLFEYLHDVISYNQSFLSVGTQDNMQLGKKLAIKNRHLILGASGFTGTDSGTGSDIPFMGKVITYQ